MFFGVTHRRLFLFLFVLSILAIITFFFQQYKIPSPKVGNIDSIPSLRTINPDNFDYIENDTIKVLLWEVGRKHWNGLAENKEWTTPNYLGHSVTRSCEINCVFTHIESASNIKLADGIIYEAFNTHYEHWEKEPLNFPPKFNYQTWFLLSYENPLYFPVQANYLEVMDGQISYDQRNSLVPISFFCSWSGGNLSDLLLPPPPKPKDLAPIVFMATNCGAGGASKRTDFVQELMKYLPIDSYGGCLHNKDFPPEWQVPIYDDHGASMGYKIQIFKKYKFVLALENNNITDYVTEKIMNVFQAGAVPIYLGAPNIREWLPGSNSAIIINDFPSTKSLIKYLQKVISDEQKYQEFFEWKKKGFSPLFLEKYHRCLFYSGHCRICKFLSTQKKKRRTENLEKALVLESLQKKKQSFLSTLYLEGHVEVKHHIQFTSKDEGVTIHLWFMIDEEEERERVLLEAGWGNEQERPYAIEAIPEGDRYYIRFCHYGTCVWSRRVFEDRRWYHVAATFSVKKQTMALYVYGRLEAELVPLHTLYPFDIYPMNLGSPFHSLSGFLDEVAVWKRILTEEELKKSLFFRPTGTEQELLSFFSFDMDNNPPGTIVDESFWRKHGTVHGSHRWKVSQKKPYYHFPCQ